jgi:hypothetical protein
MNAQLFHRDRQALARSAGESFAAPWLALTASYKFGYIPVPKRILDRHLPAVAML